MNAYGFAAGDGNLYVYANGTPTHVVDVNGRAPDGIGSYWDAHAANVHRNSPSQNVGLGVAMLGAAATGLFVLEGLPWLYLGAEVDGAWASLTLREKLLYEIGQKTLSRAAFRALARISGSGPCELAVARGAALAATQGWMRALLPSLVSGQWSATMGTGGTPALRAAFETAAAFMAGLGAGAAAGASTR